MNEKAKEQKMNPIHGTRVARSEAQSTSGILMSRDSQVSLPRATPGRASSPPSRQGLAPTGNKCKADRRSRVGVAARLASPGCVVLCLPPATPRSCRLISSGSNNDILLRLVDSKTRAVESLWDGPSCAVCIQLPVFTRNLEMPGHHCLSSRVTL